MKLSSSLLLKIGVNVCRLLLAATFIFSGFVKANDPFGTVYKIQDYLASVGIISIPFHVILVASVTLSFIEFTLGISLLFGISRRPTARVSAVFMTVMTIVTAYIFVFNPVKDCGCFGDAIILTNGQTFLKNIILLAAALIITKWHNQQIEFISDNTKWLVSTISMLYIPGFAIYCIVNLPLFDFRPFKVGTDLQAVYEKSGSAQAIDVKIIYTKNGKTLELTPEDDDPDESWTYVETRRSIKDENSLQTADFCVLDESGEDITEDIVYNEGYSFLLVIPDLKKSDEGCIDLVNEIYEYAHDNGYGFYCLTGSEDKKSKTYWSDHTGSEYAFNFAEERMLKTMVRATPGLILIKDGKIIKKWSNFEMPDEYTLTDRLEKLPIGSLSVNSTNKKIATILLMFIIPLGILTIIDRTFIGWKFYRKMKMTTKDLNLEELDKRLKLEELEKKISRDSKRSVEDEDFVQKQKTKTK